MDIINVRRAWHATEALDRHGIAGRFVEGHCEDLLGFVKKYLAKVSLSKSHYTSLMCVLHTGTASNNAV